MAIAWSEDLMTNIEEIDNQHQELFRRVNNLLEACGKGKGRDEVGRILAFFQDYTMSHFSSEEQAMKNAAYPEFERHRSEHIDFVDQISGLKQKLTKEGAGISVILLTIRTAVDWLTAHIRRSDRAFADYLSNSAPNAAKDLQ